MAGVVHEVAGDGSPGVTRAAALICVPLLRGIVRPATDQAYDVRPEQSKSTLGLAILRSGTPTSDSAPMRAV